MDGLTSAGMYEESFRMPFIISYPKMIHPKSENSNLLLNVDFAPTLLELAGIEIPDTMQGTSFLPQLNSNFEDVLSLIHI